MLLRRDSRVWIMVWECHVKGLKQADRPGMALRLLGRTEPMQLRDGPILQRKRGHCQGGSK